MVESGARGGQRMGLQLNDTGWRSAYGLWRRRFLRNVCVCRRGSLCVGSIFALVLISNARSARKLAVAVSMSALRPHCFRNGAKTTTKFLLVFIGARQTARFDIRHDCLTQAHHFRFRCLQGVHAALLLCLPW